MRLANDWPQASAPAGAEPHEGDTQGHGRDMIDCFTGDHTLIRPPRDVEVRVGGRWHRSLLKCRFNGRTKDRAVVTVCVPFWEPKWGP